MKRIVKTVSLMVSIAMMAIYTVAVFAENEDNENIIYQDDSPSKYEQILKALEIISDRDEEDMYTRGGFVTAVIRERNEPLTSGKDSVFKDVTKNIEYINTAYNLGIISGYGGLFRPDDAITPQEAAIIAIRALGYSVIPEYLKDSYLKAAGLGLFDGIDVKNGREQKLDRNQAIRMLFNMLDIEIMYMDLSNNTYKTKADGTLMHNCLNIWKERGVVNGNNYMNITGGSASGIGETIIGNDYFQNGNIDTSPYMGMLVDFYYRYDDSADCGTLVYLQPRDCKTVTISADDVESTDGIKSVSYIDSNRIRKINITDDMNVIYNGELCITLTEEDLKPLSGELKFIDNTGDGHYNLLLISSYDTYVVNSVFTNEEAFVDYVTEKYVYLNSFSDLRLTEDGKECTINDLQKWDIVQIAASKSKHNAAGIKTQQKISGAVTGVTDDSLTIDTKEVKVSEFYKLNSGKLGFDVKLGDEVCAYLDYSGKVAICELFSNMVKNAVIIRAYDDNSGEEHFIRIIDRENGKQNIKLAKTVQIDGKSYKKEKLSQKITEIMSRKYYGIVPVIYDLNKNGEVSKLNTVSGTELYELCNDKAAYYVHEANTFLRDRLYGDFCAASSTMFLYVPDNPASIDDYVVRSLQDMGDIDCNVCAFAETSSRIADIVLIKSAGEATVGETENLAIVNKKYEAVDDYGEVVDAMEVFKKGTEQTVLSKKKEGFKDIKKGDIIFFTLDPKGRLDKIAETYSMDTLKIYSKPVNAKGRFSGIVYYKEGDVIGVSPGDDIDEENIIYSNLFTKPNIYVYNTKNKKDKPRIGTIDDIMDYQTFGEKASKVFVQTNYTKVTNIVVYED